MKISFADLVTRIGRGEPIAVAIDTNLVVRQRFQFGRGLLAVLGQFTAANIKILVADVVLREIRSHHLMALEDAEQQLRKAAKALRELGLLDAETNAIMSAAEGKCLKSSGALKLEEFLHSIEAEVLDSSELADLAEVQDMYFQRRPPFEEKKKHEFPDAIALSALETWSCSNSTDVLLLTEDRGWISYADGSSRLHHGLEVAEAISATQSADPALLSNLAALLRASPGELRSFMAEDVARLYVEAEGNGYLPIDLTVTGVSLDDVLLDYLRDDDLEIVSRDEGECVVRCPLYCVIGVDASITVHLFDRVDRTSMRVSGGSMHSSSKARLDCLVTFISPSRTEEYRIDGVELIDHDLHLDVGEVQVDFSE